MTEFKETDLYEPIRAFLEEEGYQVQAEVSTAILLPRRTADWLWWN